MPLVHTCAPTLSSRVRPRRRRHNDIVLARVSRNNYRDILALALVRARVFPLCEIIVLEYVRVREQAAAAAAFALSFVSPDLAVAIGNLGKSGEIG